ncbi:MAG TPA: hypothetical protein VFT64_07505 [Rickettsiales bacterium]|nr:hypothetical protein [Rickettsiales bacterium]
MLTIKRDSMIAALEALGDDAGVTLVSYGKQRDVFQLSVDVPYWMSGFKTAEMPHKNVPAGTRICVGNIRDIEHAESLDALKEILAKIDVYPFGSSGNFSPEGEDPAALAQQREQLFNSTNTLDNTANPQSGIASARRNLTSLNDAERRELLDYLTDNLHIFRDTSDQDVPLKPPGREERKQIADAILTGITEATRYTRLDNPVRAFQFTDELRVTANPGQEDGEITYHLSGPKVLVLRYDPNTGKPDLTPLDIDMIGPNGTHRVATRNATGELEVDNMPLGDRGAIELSLSVGHYAEEMGGKSFAQRYREMRPIDRTSTEADIRAAWNLADIINAAHDILNSQDSSGSRRRGR